MILRLFNQQAFEPDHCQAMGVAFDSVLETLQLKDRDDPLCTMIARTIIELGQQGVRDPGQLQTLALKILTQTVDDGDGDVPLAPAHPAPAPAAAREPVAQQPPRKPVR